MNSSHHNALNSYSAKDYINNVIVYRCINMISNAASHVPMMVYTKINGKKKLLRNHPLNNLLKHPNPEVAGADFFTKLISMLLLHGNSYILLSHGMNKAPGNMYVIDPSKVILIL